MVTEPILQRQNQKPNFSKTQGLKAGIWNLTQESLFSKIRSAGSMA